MVYACRRILVISAYLNVFLQHVRTTGGENNILFSPPVGARTSKEIQFGFVRCSVRIVLAFCVKFSSCRSHGRNCESKLFCVPCIGRGRDCESQFFCVPCIGRGRDCESKFFVCHALGVDGTVSPSFVCAMHWAWTGL